MEPGEQTGVALKTFLTRLIWICLLPLVLLASYLALDRVRTLQAQRDLAAANLARNFSGALDRHVAARISALQTLAASSALDGAPRLDELYREAQAFRNNFKGQVVLADLSGQMIFNTTLPLGSRLPKLPRVQGHSSAQAALATGRPAVGDLFVGPVLKKPMVSLAVPVLSAGRMSHLLVVAIEAGSLQERLDELAVPAGWSLTVLDGKDEVIAHRGATPAPQGTGALRATGRFQVRSTLTPWSVLVEIPSRLYQAPIFAAAAALLATLLAATLAGGIGGLWAGRRLSAAVGALAQTPLLPLSPLICEIEAARRTLLNSREAARASRERLLRAEAIAHLGHWRYDLPEGPLRCSEEGWRVLGAAPQDLEPGLKGCLALVHPEDRAGALGAASLLALAGKAEFDCRLLRPDGEERHVALSAELWGDPEGGGVFGTVLDTTVLKEQQRELKLKHLELERFTYTVSHDLRSPLVTVKTFLGYLEQDLERGDRERIARDIGYMRGAADRMGHLLDDLLEMTRVGRVGNPPLPASFAELVQTALSLVAGAVTQRGVQVLVQQRELTLSVDAPRLVAMWQNLLDNAVKFMGEQPAPRIEVGAEGEGRDTVFFVRDNGIGIEPHLSEKVFGLFDKLDRDTPGTGLGLAIAKRVVELYQGRIWLESAGRGEGSCFRFTLPDAFRPQGKELRS